MNTSGWKSAFIGSAMALASQTALANKPLPCPMDSPLVDTVWLVQGATKQKVEDRLRAIDAEKHHQVVVVTVNNLQEYGYATTEEMARHFLNTCHVGYRWENTGVVVLYAKKASSKKYWVTPSSGVSWYIPDETVQQLWRHSLEWCKKEDVACRLDDITAGIDQIIRKQFPDQQAVKKLQDSDKAFDKHKATQESQEFFNDFALNGVIIVVLWGSVGGMALWTRALIRRNKRRALKKQIFELGIRFELEKTKYPEWFLRRHASIAKQAMEKMEDYSDDELDGVLTWLWKARFDEDISFIANEISSFEKTFKEIMGKVQSKTTETEQRIAQAKSLQNLQKKAGFKYPNIELPTIHEWSDPDKTLSLLAKADKMLDSAFARLADIPQFYNSIQGLDTKVQERFTSKKSELLKIASEHTSIYQSAKSANLLDLENQIAQFVQDFQSACAIKNISKLEILSKQAESLLSPIDSAIDFMSQQIRWYNGIPSQIASRQKQIQWMQVRSEYGQEATKYAQKTGKGTFVGYDMWANLTILQQLLISLSQSHSQKENLGEIDKKLKEFDGEFGRMKEYMWLGVALATILAEEIATAERAIRRQREAEQQRRDDEERRRRRQEEEEENSRKQKEDSSSSSRNEDTTPDWTSGGGSGGDGGGGGFD